ncbi:uncharacterized protein UTRI_03258_B [Ustilago trichophora]|uniref:Uncharacterized protein n=1 Tax=Ustilago trichophora TaxID=86804 RepID=A0A5C3E752_9BASI|nr:uncharacterized protein UTRI_03258_B [Ustilago trichophora]
MSLTGTSQTLRAMTQDKQKGSPGFFSVLLGRGTADPSGSTQAATEKLPREESRTTQPSQSAFLQGRAYAQGRAPYAAEVTAPPRSSMARDRIRTDAKRDASAPRPHSTAAFEAAVRNHNATLTDRSKPNTRPPVSSMRSPHKDTFVDAKESQEAQGESSTKARHSRKVSFNTPTSSLRKGKIGASRMDEAGSSQDSFFSPSAPRPTSKSTKPKYTRSSSSSKAELEERNWNSSTATLQNKDEPRSRSSKHRRSKVSSYPLATDAYGDSFQAVRVSGPDRVVIVPVTPSSTEEEFMPEKRHLSAVPAPPPALRRPGPAPIVPHASASKRISQDVSMRKSGDVQHSRSHRTRSNHDTDASVAKQSSRSRSRPDKMTPRNSTSTRPFPEPVGTTVLSQNMARARSGDRNQSTMSMFHERPSNTRIKAQRA